jgi:hypothetical protein
MSDWTAVSLPDGNTPIEFFNSFRVREPNGLLDLLLRWKAVVTGADFVTFVSTSWKRSLEERPRCLVLDVLCPGAEAQAAFVRYLFRTGYRRNGYACRHSLGEWAHLPDGSVCCLTEGSLSQRVVHVVRLKAKPEAVILSRVYGSMIGTYLTGNRRVVSLFPYLTIQRRQRWLPEGASACLQQECARKYSTWPLASRDTWELDVPFRTAVDKHCWSLLFDTRGIVVSVQLPVEIS